MGTGKQWKSHCVWEYGKTYIQIIVCIVGVPFYLIVFGLRLGVCCICPALTAFCKTYMVGFEKL